MYPCRTHLKILHGEVDTICLSIGDPEVARPGRASTNDYSIVLCLELIRVQILTNVCVGNERLRKLFEAEAEHDWDQKYIPHPRRPSGQDGVAQSPCRVSCCKAVNKRMDEDMEINLLGNTVHEETTHAVVAVVNGDIVPSLVELVGTCKSSRARTYDSNSLASAELRGVWLHPTHLEALRKCK